MKTIYNKIEIIVSSQVPEDTAREKRDEIADEIRASLILDVNHIIESINKLQVCNFVVNPCLYNN